MKVIFTVLFPILIFSIQSFAKDFRYGDYRNVDFSGQILVDADFTGADVRGANFTNAWLSGATFARANASGANFNTKLVSNVIFDFANLEGAYFRRGTQWEILDGPSFRGANLKNAQFLDFPAYNCDFSYANLSGAKFDHVRISRSKFIGADLRDVEIKNPHSNFYDADLRDARMEGLIFPHHTVFSGCRYNQLTINQKGQLNAGPSYDCRNY